MRINRKLLVLVLSVVMLVNLVGVQATAAENESPLRLYVSPVVTPDVPFPVQIITDEAQTVADGKLVVTYDPEMLTYVGTETGSAWNSVEAVTLSVNAAEGKVILAFASADAANAGILFSLTFQPKTNGHSTVALDGSSYLSDVDADLACQVVASVVNETPVSVTLNAGAHGTFADGTDTTVITALADAALTSNMLAPVVADRGYALTGWLDQNGTLYALDEEIIAADGLILTAQYTFVCDGIDCPSAQFVDLKTVSPESHAALDYMIEHGYMNGMTSTMFGPHVDLDRAMMVTILYRIAGEPAVETENTFTDVPSGKFYTNAVSWAAETGITTGVSNTLFAPSKDLTRQELATFLYRFAKYMGYDVSAADDLSAYTDASSVGSFAVEAVRWAVAEGVIKGTSATTLSPAATTTRLQVALMVYRLLAQQN